MEYKTYAKILRGVGGLYTVSAVDEARHTDAAKDGRLSAASPLAGQTLNCRARAASKSDGRLLAGDDVVISYTDASFIRTENGVEPKKDPSGVPEAAIETTLPRKNSLIRPPMANLDLLFVACAAASPAPAADTIDRILCAAEYRGIECAIIIGKCELDRARAEELRQIYLSAYYPTFVLSCKTGEGVEPFADFVREKLCGRVAAFAGASGAGKSTLMNSIFPHLQLTSGEVSRKTERGRHTTRQVELFPVGGGFFADTPGFSLVDFENFDFLPLEALASSMREFEACPGQCRYPDCSHTKEDGCKILAALERGDVSRSRHASYLSMLAALRTKPKWKKNGRG